MKKVLNVYESGEYEVKYVRKNFLIFTWLEKVYAEKISNDIIIQVKDDSYPPDKIIVLCANGGELIYKITPSKEDK